MTPLPILPLSQSVINRIAAGEVLHRPSSALKELLENSVDAHASRVNVSLGEGGLRLLQVADNGVGVRREDMLLLCRRFTTSKIRDYSDVQGVRTFGFRGEALASLTHVARVTVVSRVRGSACAYRAEYSDGEVLGGAAGVKACAGVHGTVVTAADLFFNVPARRAALSSAHDEASRCLEVVTKYGIHYAGQVGFSCCKAGSSVAEASTLSCTDTLSAIRSLYGPVLAASLLPFSCELEAISTRVSGFLSSSSFRSGRSVLLMLVNGRLVESSALRQTVSAVYSRYLPKHSHGWLYVSIECRGQDVDVNVHPTKREVLLLHQDAIMDGIEHALDLQLRAADSSRTYSVNVVAPSQPPASKDSRQQSQRQSQPDKDQRVEGKEDAEEEEQEEGEAAALSGFARQGGGEEEHVDTLVSLTSVGRDRRRPPLRPNRLVRTDARQAKLASFFSRAQQSDAATAGSASSSSPPTRSEAAELDSVRRLLTLCQSASQPSLCELFRDGSFVGVVDGCFSLLQHRTALYLVNHQTLSEALHYQTLLRKLGRLPRIRLSPPVSVQEMLQLLPASPTSSSSSSQSVFASVSSLLGFRAMLADYFSVVLSADGQLCCLPSLLPHYDPPMLALPVLLRRLCTEVDWTDEQACIRGVSRAIAAFSRIQPHMYCTEETSSSSREGQEEGKDGAACREEKQEAREAEEEEASGLPQQVRWCIEHELFAAARHGFSPPASFLTDGCLTKVATLEQLYRIFERC